jgi:hypothetical protein
VRMIFEPGNTFLYYVATPRPLKYLPRRRPSSTPTGRHVRLLGCDEEPL